MAEMRDVFNIVCNRGAINTTQQFYPPKIYLDPLQIKKQKDAANRQYQREQKGNRKLDKNVSKKTYLDQLEKRQKAYPSPHTYQPKSYEAGYKKRTFTSLPSRKTIFEDMKRNDEKNPVPGSGAYQTLKSKSISMGQLDKAENTTCVDGAIFNAASLPGVGQYNSSKSSLSKKYGKWNKSLKKLNSNKQNFQTSPNQYNPSNLDKGLFSEISKLKKKSSSFNKQKRFSKNQQGCKNLYYTGISKWGQSQHKSNDFLTKYARYPTDTRSVYHS